MEQHPEVRFSITDEDVRALREYRPGRMRVPLLERSLHAFAAFVALAVVLIALIARRPHRLPVYLGVVAGVWIAAWAWLVFVFLRRSPRSKAWLAKLRMSPVLTRGDCIVSMPAPGVLQVTTPASSHMITSEHLENLIYSGTHLYVRIKTGQVVIVPRREFASDEEFADFVADLPMRREDDAANG